MLSAKNILGVAAALSLCVWPTGVAFAVTVSVTQRLLGIPLHCNKHHKSNRILQNNLVNVQLGGDLFGIAHGG